MKQYSFVRAAALALALLVVWGTATEVMAQAAGETDAAESMGVGMKSRFASGATPITIQRTTIVPGTPMSVNSTMSNILTSSNGSSFGGILARYDTSTFGKFFGTGQMTQRARNTRLDALEALDQGDNEVDNVEVDRMYPPRLVLDPSAFPIHSLSSQAGRSNMTMQIENAISRFDFDRRNESIRAECRGSVVVLKGRVRSARLARLVENIVSMQPGVERVENEILVLEPETKNVDVFGRPLD